MPGELRQEQGCSADRQARGEGAAGGGTVGQSGGVSTPETDAPARPAVTVRDGREDDVEAVVGLVHELADYERSADQVRVTPEQLHRALFAGAAPDGSRAAYLLVAEEDGETIGFALWFLNFSTWEGVHGIYLEDLYVRPEHRGTGLGKALLTSLAGIAVARGFARVEWSVLDWNTPSIEFYKAQGAAPLDEWTVFRLTDDALTRFAASSRDAGAPRPA